LLTEVMHTCNLFFCFPVLDRYPAVPRSRSYAEKQVRTLEKPQSILLENYNCLCHVAKLSLFIVRSIRSTQRGHNVELSVLCWVESIVNTLV